MKKCPHCKIELNKKGLTVQFIQQDVFNYFAEVSKDGKLAKPIEEYKEKYDGDDIYTVWCNGCTEQIGESSGDGEDAAVKKVLEELFNTEAERLAHALKSNTEFYVRAKDFWEQWEAWDDNTRLDTVSKSLFEDFPFIEFEENIAQVLTLEICRLALGALVENDDNFKEGLTD